MKTQYLVTFKTILETGSFQKAADKLGYTQSTITFQIKQLEEELSLKLFEKIGRRMELTQAGKDIMPYVDMILQGTEQIRNYGKKLSEISGSLKLAIQDMLCGGRPFRKISRSDNYKEIQLLARGQVPE